MTESWIHRRFEGGTLWDAPGGLAATTEYIFTADHGVGPNRGGIIRFDQASNDSLRFADEAGPPTAEGFRQVNLGLDGLLYGTAVSAK